MAKSYLAMVHIAAPICIMKDFEGTSQKGYIFPNKKGLQKKTVNLEIWSGRKDLNLRHPAPKAGALPDCATPRLEKNYLSQTKL